MGILFSMIVPMYNAENYIKKTIASLQNQTYSSIEIILVDDGSTDHTLDICKEAAHDDPRIKIIAKENGGPSSARNAGIKEAQGEFIVFCDADDNLHLDFCENAFELLEKEKYDLIVFGITNILISNNKESRQDVFLPSCSSISHEDSLPIFLDLMIKGIAQGPCAKIYKSEIIKGNTLTFDDQIFFGEDTLFNLQYMKNTNTMYVSEKCLYEYIQRENKGRLTRRKQNKYRSNLTIKKELDALYKTGPGINEKINVIYQQLYISYLNSIIDDRPRKEILHAIKESLYEFIPEFSIIRNFGLERRILSFIIKTKSPHCIYILCKGSLMIKHRLSSLYYKIMSK